MSTGNLKLVVNNGAAPDPATAPPELITKATVERFAKRPATGRDEYIQDSEIPGFKLRRTRHGTVVYFFHGRIRGEGCNKGSLIKRTFGRATGKGAITVARARADAVALREQLVKGIDPIEEQRAKDEATAAKQREREQQAKILEWTPAYALTHMLEWRATKKDTSLHFKRETIEFYQRGIGYLGKLANVPIVELKADDIRTALDKIDGKAKPAKAKRALSGVIAHAIKRLELNIANPVSRLDRGEFKAPPPRESYINEADIGGFIRKVLAIDIPGKPRESRRARDYMLLTLLYGTRKEELMRCEWAWINWDTGTITIPATVTKQKREHRLPLTPWTRAILKARREATKRDSAYVFPGEKSGQLDPITKRPLDQPVTNIRRSLASAVGSEFKLHDARRTLITHCASLGIHGARLKAIVGHARQGVTENYDQREIEQVRRDLITYHEWLDQKAEQRSPEAIRQLAVQELMRSQRPVGRARLMPEEMQQQARDAKAHAEQRTSAMPLAELRKVAGIRPIWERVAWSEQ